VKAGIFLFVLLFAPDAAAWGLQTHVFLAQWLLAAAPFADPQFRAAALRLPRLVLAGACLPDLALAGRMIGVRTFRRAHQWSTLHRLAATCWDEERAIAVGYASHLLADVVAHNRFVPEHERRIVDVPHLTHAICEWAMDEHLKKGLTLKPAELLRSEGPMVAATVARTFGCSEALAGRTIRVLAGAEWALRASPLPRLCRRVVDFFDLEVVPRFDAYIGDASALVRRIEAVLHGEVPRWQPEPEGKAAEAAGQAMRNEPPAIRPPSAPPAITSLG
jgi:Zinc dependent phospholipase C